MGLGKPTPKPKVQETQWERCAGKIVRVRYQDACFETTHHISATRLPKDLHKSHTSQHGSVKFHKSPLLGEDEEKKNHFFSRDELPTGFLIPNSWP